jgi:phosphatidylinositol alpha-1,6-mannosyltransferase
MVCGLSVIGGNMDGSTDALRDGTLGTLVNPNDSMEITEAIRKNIINQNKVTEEDKFELQREALKYFGFPAFKDQLRKILL